MLIKHKKNKSGEHFLKEKKNKFLMRGGATTLDTAFITNFETVYAFNFIGQDLKAKIGLLKNALINYIRSVSVDGKNHNDLLDAIKLEFTTILNDDDIIDLFQDSAVAARVAAPPELNQYKTSNNTEIIQKVQLFLENEKIKDYIFNNFDTVNFIAQRDDIRNAVDKLANQYINDGSEIAAIRIENDDIDAGELKKTDNDTLCRQIKILVQQSHSQAVNEA